MSLKSVLVVVVTVGVIPVFWLGCATGSMRESARQQKRQELTDRIATLTKQVGEIQTQASQEPACQAAGTAFVAAMQQVDQANAACPEIQAALAAWQPERQKLDQARAACPAFQAANATLVEAQKAHQKVLTAAMLKINPQVKDLETQLQQLQSEVQARKMQDDLAAFPTTTAPPQSNCH